MAVSSLLNPDTIVRERPTTAAAAQNFITGGSPLGEGVVASAANKIVGFQRGATAVAARPPDLQGIIQTLSTNILNNVESRVQSINQNVTQLINSNLKGLGDDYKSRLDQIDSARPNSILSNFLNLYKEAIGYIQFLGNRKNVKTLGDNLRALQNVFAETFNVAKIIRQTIVRIVKQLSNLPQATGGGGGLNLDINVPGGPLRRTLPGGRTGRMLKMAGMGAAAVGAGALGSQVVSGMMDVGGDVQPAPASEGMIPGSLLDRFNGILDKFSAAINSLGTRRAEPRQSSSGGTTAQQKPTTPPAGQPGGPSGPVVSSAPGDEKLAAFVATMEASSPENAADAMQVMLNRSASGKYGKGLSGVLSGYDQFSPISAAIYGDSDDPAAKAKYGPIAAKLPGKTPQEKFQYLQKVAAEPDGLNKLQQIFGGGSASVAGTILNDPKYLEMSRQNVKNAQNFYGGKKVKASDLQVRPGGNNFYNFTGPIGKLGSQPTGTVAALTKPTVAPSGGQQQVAQQVAQTVSQPPAQQSSTVTVAPMDMTSPQTQSRKVGDKSIPPPAMNKGGVTVPFLSSSNNDNFLTLYSRIVYNIVDG